MNSTAEMTVQREVKRIGILLADLGKLNTSVLKYLVLHLNTLQKTFEFEFLPTEFDEDILQFSEELQREGILRREDALQEDELIFLKDFVRKFSDRTIVDRNPATDSGKKLREQEIPVFRQCYYKYLRLSIRGFKISDQEVPEHFVLITTAHFSENYYSLREKDFTILALGGWERDLAPPSIIEYILTLILRQSVAMVSRSLEGSVHFGTKGCLCDFSQSLYDVRLNILNGFVCSYCRAALVSDGFGTLANELEHVLKKDWLGNVAEPYAPTRLAASMGYNLFVTKGFIMTRWEKLQSLLTEQFSIQLIALIASTIAGVLVGIILARLAIH